MNIAGISRCCAAGLVICAAAAIALFGARHAFAETVQSCTSGAVLGLGEYTLENNTWNAQSTTNYTQCVTGTAQASGMSGQLQWSWPNLPSQPNFNQVKAYPEIIYGWKPWYSRSTTTNLPLRVSEIDRLKIAVDSTMNVTGAWNFAFDIWLTNSGTVASNPSAITHEIMIWLADDGMVPAGSFVEQVMIEGQAYKFYQGSMPAWSYLAFRSVSPQLSTSIRLRPFLQYLVAKRIVPAASYLASIELGNEIISGTGTTSLAHYAVTRSLPAIPLLSAVLPSSRAVKIGNTATVFSTIINAGTAPATGCTIQPCSMSVRFCFRRQIRRPMP